MWVRGLKQQKFNINKKPPTVAPYVGAWIETSKRSYRCSTSMSHPMWVRGLKPAGGVEPPQSPWSHPMWVRGLKLVGYYYLLLVAVSHPMWVRGLKLNTSQKNGVECCRTLCGCVD